MGRQTPGQSSGLRVLGGLGLRILGLGFGVRHFGFGVKGLRFRV